jgi:hypothetical protein
VAIRFGVSSTVKNRLPRYSNFWDGTAVYSPFSPTGSYDALATYTVPSGGVTNIVFAGLPTGGQYSHLQIRGIGRRSDAQSYYDNSNFYFNNDLTNTNYYRHYLIGYGSGSPAAGAANIAPAVILPGNSQTANLFSPFVIDILDYASTTKYKVVRTLSGIEPNSTSGEFRFQSGLWNNTNAINSITFAGNSGFVQNTQISLYGVRG